MRGVAISARILSALGGGRAGVALPSYPSGSESTTPVRLCGLQQNAETRSNSDSSTPARPIVAVDFRIDLYDGTNGAKVASTVATVPARGSVQLDRILRRYAPGVAQGCALVDEDLRSEPLPRLRRPKRRAEPGQRSGDGAYVASVPASP